MLPSSLKKVLYIKPVMVNIKADKIYILVSKSVSTILNIVIGRSMLNTPFYSIIWLST